MKPISIGSVTPTSGPQRGVWDVLFFSWANNVWFGIGVLAAIFVYSSLGSAVPPLRQHPWLEMTEMEWFGWWPFELMIALMCINMTVVTIRQIPLRLVNAGVWSIHVGIILLAVGSVYYFGTKQEGDIPVYRRRATINVPGVAAPVTMLIRPGNHVTANGDSGEYHFSVSQIFPDWRISSGADAGKTTYAVWISVETPTERFTRQLLAGFPQYTEDILSSGQRAKKVRGEPLVDPSLIMSLDYEPQDRFFLMDSSALYVRDAGDPEWLQRPIEGLPHYHERIRSPDDVLLAPGEEPPPLRPIDIPVDAAGPDDPLADYDVRLTAFLRYAFFSATWMDGGARLNPVARLVLDGGEFGAVDHELVAFDAKRNTAEDGQIVFRWFRTPEELEQLAASSESYLTIRVPDAGVNLKVPIASIRPRAGDGSFRPIEGTPYAYRLKNVARNLMMRSGDRAGQTMSVALVEIKTPERTFTRFVSDVADAIRDTDDEHKMVDPDPAIEMEFFPGVAAMITLAAGPPEVGTHVLVRLSDDTVDRLEIGPGQSVPVANGLRLTLDYLFTHARQDVRPRIVPPAQRDRNARETFSMIRLEITKGEWSKSKWLDFNRYALPSEQYAIARRISYHPSSVVLPDGRDVELVFSRKSVKLPAAIALDRFELATHTGGYTGSTLTIRDFVSQLRFKTENGWTEPQQMSMNLPAHNGGYWYFQSTWDPPAEGYAGMNYTGLGVGNRNGVHIQLAGTIIAVSGMIFAFYFKPIVRRRMQQAERRTDGLESTAVATAESVGDEREVVQPIGLG